MKLKKLYIKKWLKKNTRVQLMLIFETRNWNHETKTTHAWVKKKNNKPNFSIKECRDMKLSIQKKHKSIRVNLITPWQWKHDQDNPMERKVIEKSTKNNFKKNKHLRVKFKKKT